MDTREVMEKLNGLRVKLNEQIAKLPFIGLAEKIPAGTREKAPVLNRAIPWANHIACALVVVVLIGGISSCGGKYNPDKLVKEFMKENGLTKAEYKKGLAENGMTEKQLKEYLVSQAKASEAGGSGGGGNMGVLERAVAIAESNARTAVPKKGSGKNHTLNKEADFKYDLVQIDGTDYVVIQDIHLPSGFKEPSEEPTGKRIHSIVDPSISIPETITVIHDTLTVNIPEKIEGYTVGRIEYIGHGSLVTAITLPDTVLEIESRDARRYTDPTPVFSGFTLTSIKLPKNLKTIGGAAFKGSALTSITIPEGVTAIWQNAFEKSALRSITIPASVTVIGDYAFSESALTSVTLSAGVTVIGERAFYKTAITSVTIPAGITEIRPYTFSSCKSLKEVTIPDSVTYIGRNAFYNCSELTTVKLPSHPIKYDPETYSDKATGFGDCPKLSLAVRKAIQDTGYDGSF